MVRSRTLAAVVLLAVSVGVGAHVVAATGADGTGASAPTATDAGAGGGLADGSALQTTQPDDSVFVSPPQEAVARERHTTGGFDLAASAAADAQALRGRYREAVFVERFESAREPEAVLETFATALADRLDALDRHHARLLERYSSGEYSTARLLRELARTTAAADAEASLAETVESTAAGATADLPAEFERIGVTARREISALESPVTDALAGGELEPDAGIYAQATSDALVLATAGESHVRQATLRGERDPDGENQFEQQSESANINALDRAELLYADAVGFDIGFPIGGATDVYRLFNGDSGFGNFSAYLDGATTNVFHEVHFVDSSEMPVSDTVTAVEGVELTVRTSEPTGPMLVSVTEGDQPVAGARIEVGPWSVGATDSTGQRWVTQPLGTFEVNATVGGETVTAQVG